MRDLLKIIGIAAIFIAFFGFMIWWQVFRYQDCKMVGHSTTYCIFTIGK